MKKIFLTSALIIFPLCGFFYQHAYAYTAAQAQNYSNCYYNCLASYGITPDTPESVLFSTAGIHTQSTYYQNCRYLLQ